MSLENFSQEYANFHFFCYTMQLLLTKTEDEIIEELNKNGESRIILFLAGCNTILEEFDFTTLTQNLPTVIKNIANEVRFYKYEDSDIRKSIIYLAGEIIGMLNIQEIEFENKENVFIAQEKFLSIRNLTYNYSRFNKEHPENVLINLSRHYDVIISIDCCEDSSYFREDYAYLEVMNYLIFILNLENNYDREIFNYMVSSVNSLMKAKNTYKDKKYIKYLLRTYKNIVDKERELDEIHGKLKRRSL